MRSALVLAMTLVCSSWLLPHVSHANERDGRYQIVVKGPDTWQGPHILFRIDTATGAICRLQTATREGGDMSKGVAWVKSCTDSGQVFDLDGLTQNR